MAGEFPTAVFIAGEKKNTDDRAGEIKGTNIDGAALIVGQNHN